MKESISVNHDRMERMLISGVARLKLIDQAYRIIIDLFSEFKEDEMEIHCPRCAKSCTVKSVDTGVEIICESQSCLGKIVPIFIEDSSI